jgi:hypothetical protein
MQQLRRLFNSSKNRLLALHNETNNQEFTAILDEKNQTNATATMPLSADTFVLELPVSYFTRASYYRSLQLELLSSIFTEADQSQQKIYLNLLESDQTPFQLLTELTKYKVILEPPHNKTQKTTRISLDNTRLAPLCKTLNKSLVLTTFKVNANQIMQSIPEHCLTAAKKHKILKSLLEKLERLVSDVITKNSEREAVKKQCEASLLMVLAVDLQATQTILLSAYDEYADCRDHFINTFQNQAMPQTYPIIDEHILQHVNNLKMQILANTTEYKYLHTAHYASLADIDTNIANIKINHAKWEQLEHAIASWKILVQESIKEFNNAVKEMRRML